MNPTDALASLHPAFSTTPRAESAPPWDHDEEAEATVLSAVLIDHGDEPTGVWQKVAAILTADDFHYPPHGLYFTAFERVIARGAQLDDITVPNELRAMGRYNTAGGDAYFKRLIHTASTTAHAEAHARIVADHATRRKVAVIARGLMTRAQDLTRPIGATLAGAQATLAAVPVPGALAPTLSADVEAYSAILEGSLPTGPAPVSLGLADLDAGLRGGLRKGSWLLVGLPGVGKTTLAAQIVAHVAATQGPVLFVSKEQQRSEIRDIFLAHLARLPLGKVIDARENPERMAFTQDELTRLTFAMNTLHALPAHVMDPSTPGCPNTVLEILATARGMNPLPVLVVIDNLGELDTRAKYRDRDEAQVEKMRDLRAAKDALGIPFLTLAHPNAQALAGRQGRKLREGDVAGGQAASRVADGTIFMHDENKHATCDHEKHPPTPGVVEVYGTKIRGLSRPLLEEVFAIPSEHRFTSTRARDEFAVFDARVSMVHARSPVAVVDDGEGLPGADAPLPTALEWAAARADDDRGPQDAAAEVA